jgi:hypothetical protein
MRFAQRGNLVQRAAGQAAAEHAIDLRNAQRHGRRAVFQAKRALERAQALSKFLDHVISLGKSSGFTAPCGDFPRVSFNTVVLYLF